MRPNKQYILVRIDKQKRDIKREKKGNIYLSPSYLYMAYNLQYGEILGIGSKAQRDFPDAEIGDIAIFHHSVEGDRESPSRDNLIDTDEAGNEIRLVEIDDNPKRMYQMFAIMKPDGYIIPSPYHVFLENKTEKIQKKLQSSLIEIDNDFNLSEDVLNQKIESLKVQAQSIAESMSHMTNIHDFESARRGLDEINGYRTKLTQLLNKKHFVTGKVLYIAANVSVETQLYPNDTAVIVGQSLYPIEIMGTEYLIADLDLIYAKVTEKEPEQEEAIA